MINDQTNEKMLNEVLYLLVNQLISFEPLDLNTIDDCGFVLTIIARSRAVFGVITNIAFVSIDGIGVLNSYGTDCGAGSLVLSNKVIIVGFFGFAVLCGIVQAVFFKPSVNIGDVGGVGDVVAVTPNEIPGAIDIATQTETVLIVADFDLAA